MKLKQIESIPVMKVPKRPPARKKTLTAPLPEPTPVEEPIPLTTPLCEGALQLSAPPVPGRLPLPAPEPKPEKTPQKIEERILLLKRFCDKIQSDPENYEKNHPTLWQLYQEVQELVKE